MGTLFTIGYEGASLSDFIATLQHSGVRRVALMSDMGGKLALVDCVEQPD